jgi:hypothetical protein
VLERSTLADWVGQTSALLRPLIDALERHVMAGDRLYADDTPVPVLAPGTGKTRTGRLWAYLRDERPFASSTPPAVRYRYSPDRRAEHPRAHLASFQGVLQADGYNGFDGLYANGRIAEAACWAELPKVPRAQRVEWQRRATSDATSTTSMSVPGSRRSPVRHWNGSANSMPLKQASSASRQTSDGACVRAKQDR